MTKKLFLGTLILSAAACFAETYWQGKYPRALPLRELECKKVIYAKDFGAIPDDGKCDASALQNALDELTKNQNAKLVIEKGVYDISFSPKGKERAFYIEQAKNVHIDAQGSTFLISAPFLGLFTVYESENVLIENIILDYKILPHTSARITSIDKKNLSINAEVFKDHPRLDAENLQTSGTGFFMDSKIAGRPKTGMANGYSLSKLEYLGKTAEGLESFKVFFKELKEIDFLETGDVYTRTCKRSAAAFGGGFLRQVTFKNIDIYASPAGAFTVGRSELVNFINCTNKIKEGRWKSTNADAFHIPNNRQGVWIENCQIEGIADDCVNIYLVPTFAVEQPALDTLRIVPKGSKNDKPLERGEFFVGDEVFFFRSKTNVIFDSARVVSVDYATGLVKFDKALENIDLGLEKSKCTTIYNASNSKGNVIINSVFKNSKRFGLFIKATDVLIENNYFEGLSSSAITLHNEPGWPEGLFSRRIVIRGNKFKDNGFEEHYELKGGWPGGAITSLAAGAKSKTPFYLNCDLLIENNEFLSWRGRAIYLRDTKDVVIKNNKICAPTPPLSDKFRINASAFAFENCANIVAENNANQSGNETLIREK